MTDTILKEYVLVRFSKKTGKIDTTLEALGNATLKLWALQNTTKTKDTVIFAKDSGDIVEYYEGTGDFPKITKPDDKVKNIEDLCPGLLEAVQ